MLMSMYFLFCYCLYIIIYKFNDFRFMHTGLHPSPSTPSTPQGAPEYPSGGILYMFIYRSFFPTGVGLGRR